MAQQKFFATREELKAEYEACYSLEAVGRKFGVSKKLILNKMKRFGIARKGYKTPVEAIRKLAFIGMSAPQIALNLGYTPEGIRWAGKKYGIAFEKDYGEGRKPGGYKTVKAPGHPHANQYGKVLVHRLVVEAFLGRYLNPNEVVHHINGNIADNRIENLQVFRSNGEHLLGSTKRRTRKARTREDFSQTDTFLSR